jgi:hypothetical protein
VSVKEILRGCWRLDWEAGWIVFPTILSIEDWAYLGGKFLIGQAADNGVVGERVEMFLVDRILGDGLGCGFQ